MWRVCARRRVYGEDGYVNCGEKKHARVCVGKAGRHIHTHLSHTDETRSHGDAQSPARQSGWEDREEHRTKCAWLCIAFSPSAARARVRSRVVDKRRVNTMLYNTMV